MIAIEEGASQDNSSVAVQGQARWPARSSFDGETLSVS